ncbi:hypothetical protein Zm00014a_040738 [Zea mays]|uniref:Uncharacterized protein n=1 Tax=Zea mays TaxID=4577 RepID=A0A3L6G2N9_MAIZE|nr:hypothetical protein Zm00014a_040738 [Zea mays]
MVTPASTAPASTASAAAATGSGRGVLRLLRYPARCLLPLAAAPRTGTRLTTVLRARTQPAEPELVEQ